MSPPNKISPPTNVIYDDVQRVCRLAESGEEQAASAEPAFSPISRSRLLEETVGASHRSRSWWSGNLWQVTPFAFLISCNGSDEPVALGNPVLFVDPLGGETAMNAQPIQNPGKLNGYALSGAGAGTLVAWSAFDSTHPAQSGTFAFLRSGSGGGSQITVNNDALMLHEFTSAAVLDNGDAFVSYTSTQGTEAASSIVAQRLSSGGTSQIMILDSLASGARLGFPAAQLVSTGTGFVAVYRDGNGQLFAAAFDGRGVPQGTPQNLGPISDSTPFSISRGTGDHWVLAQIASPNQIRVRTFSGITPSGVGQSITSSGFPASPNLSVAMSEEGKTMLVWNVQGGGLYGAVLDSGGSVQSVPFQITASGLANTLALASDHYGNFVFAWEQAGSILARIYDGTSKYSTPADFSIISSGNQNSNVMAYVTDNGILTLTWIRSRTVGGNTQQDVVRRDYQLNYKP